MNECSPPHQLVGKTASHCFGNVSHLFLTSSGQVYYLDIGFFFLLLPTLHGDIIDSYIEVDNLINKATK